MRRTPRFFPSDLPPRERRVYGAVTAFFLVVFVASIWPVYPLFAGIRPMVLGIPFSLFYVIVLLLVAFLVLLGLFLWEGRRGIDEPDGPEGAAAAAAEERAA